MHVTRDRGRGLLWTGVAEGKVAMTGRAIWAMLRIPGKRVECHRTVPYRGVPGRQLPSLIHMRRGDPQPDWCFAKQDHARPRGIRRLVDPRGLIPVLCRHRRALRHLPASKRAAPPRFTRS